MGEGKSRVFLSGDTRKPYYDVRFDGCTTVRLWLDNPINKDAIGPLRNLRQTIGSPAGHVSV